MTPLMRWSVQHTGSTEVERLLVARIRELEAEVQRLKDRATYVAEMNQAQLRDIHRKFGD